MSLKHPLLFFILSVSLETLLLRNFRRLCHLRCGSCFRYLCRLRRCCFRCRRYFRRCRFRCRRRFCRRRFRCCRRFRWCRFRRCRRFCRHRRCSWSFRRCRSCRRCWRCGRCRGCRRRWCCSRCRLSHSRTFRQVLCRAFRGIIPYRIFFRIINNDWCSHLNVIINLFRYTERKVDTSMRSTIDITGSAKAASPCGVMQSDSSVDSHS